MTNFSSLFFALFHFSTTKFKGSNDGQNQALSMDSLTSEGSNSHTVVVSVVNPQGIITNIPINQSNDTSLAEKFSNENYILENCDETMFRPLIAVMNVNQHHFADDSVDIDECSKPVEMPLELVVPVIDERVIEEKKRTREMEQQEKIQKQVTKEKMREEAERKKLEEAEQRKLEEIRKLEKENEMKKADEEEKKLEIALKAQDEKKQEAPQQSRRNKKAQKYNNKKESVKKVEIKVEDPIKIIKDDLVIENPIDETVKVEVIEEPQKVEEIAIKEIEIQKAEEMQNKEMVEEITINTPTEPVDSLTEDLKKVDLNIEEISMEVPVVEENLRLSVELPLFEKDLESMDLPSAVEIVEDIEQPAIVENKPEIITPKESDAKVSKKSKKTKKKVQEQSSKSDELFSNDFPPLELPTVKNEDDREANKDAIMKISMHETIGDEDIQIIPHEDTVEIRETSPEPLKEEKSSNFNKNDDFYDIEDDLPPLEPFTFEGDDIKCEDEEYLQKQEMKSKMSKLLKDTNMVFAMCSSLKELSEGEASLSSSSHIQRSTSSSLTTNTTTATFASASSNAVGEGPDSDYKSLDFEMEEAAADTVVEFKIPQAPEKDEPEDISSFEATSSETDAEDSSKKTNLAETFKREDDEELRPLLETSLTSLSSPVDATTNITTTEANATSTLPEPNQKSQTTTTNTSNNNGKRKNKKKRR